MSVELDWQNRPVPAGEEPEAVIKVWEVSPHLSPDYDCLVVRGWQEMLDMVRNIAESQLENGDSGELEDGITIKIRLREMTRAEYDEAFED